MYIFLSLKKLIPFKKTIKKDQFELKEFNIQKDKDSVVELFINLMIPLFILKIKLYTTKQLKNAIESDSQHIHKDITIIIKNFNFVMETNDLKNIRILISLRSLQIVHQYQYSKLKLFENNSSKEEKYIIEVNNSEFISTNNTINYPFEKLSSFATFSKSKLNDKFAYLISNQNYKEKTQTIEIYLQPTIVGLDHELIKYLIIYFTNSENTIKSFNEEFANFYIDSNFREEVHKIPEVNPKSYKLTTVFVDLNELNIYTFLNNVKFWTINLEKIKVAYINTTQEDLSVNNLLSI